MAQKLAVGLDIGSSSVKLVHLRESKRGYVLDAFAVAPLPPEAIVDGALMNSAAIVDAIRELFAQAKIKNKNVAIGISGHSVIIKKISLPKMSKEELDESIQWEAEQYIPFDVKDVNIDVKILGTGDDATGQMDVLLVAAKKDMINDYTAVIAEAGLIPTVVAVDAFAVQRAFEASYEVSKTETVVLINVGASVVNINVIANGITTFTRDVSMGGNQFTEEIQKQLNVSYDEAEKLKVGGDLTETDSVIPQEVERVIQGVAEQLAGEIQRSLDFYAATAADSHISKVYLSGGTAKIPSLFKVIEQRVGVPVEILNPFKAIEIDNRKFDPNYLMDISPSATVGVGLALRKLGDDEINLLPVRASKKRELGRQWLVLFGLVFLAAVLGNYFWYSERQKTLEAVKGRIAQYERDIATLNKIIGEVKNIKAEKADMEQKLGILKKLRDGRSGPVKVMDELATIIPQRVWLSTYEENAGNLNLVGTATSLEEVANFVKKLQGSKFFSGPRLAGPVRAEAGGERVSFTISCGVKYAP